MASLFDDIEEEESFWQEVPAARFFSWPPAMQLAYCAERDEDSAMHASTPEEIDWYLARARTYRELMSSETR